MEQKTITFVANRHWLNKLSISAPSPISKWIPKWYSIADRFFKDEKDAYILDDEGGKMATWKGCPALLDIFTSGYVLKTPCDITFSMNENDEIEIKAEDSRYDDFCVMRPPLAGFPAPAGYNKNSFAWMSDWGIETPEGYSCLYLTPVNRFDLPFINTTGIIDTDKVSVPGSLPFFILDGWTGTIPAGTPYAQIFPFKRENWDSEIRVDRAGDIYDRVVKTRKIFRQPNGGVYKDKFWERREYK
jgi:hypothetical protein